MSGSLAHSPADILRQLLVDLDLGSYPANPPDAWPVYVASEPDRPDECVTVYDTAGRPQGRLQVSGEKPELHGVQVRVRSARPPEGWAKARTIAVALDESVYAETVTMTGGSSYCVHSVTRTTDVVPLGKESPQSKRSIFVLNALVCLRAS